MHILLGPELSQGNWQASLCAPSWAGSWLEHVSQRCSFQGRKRESLGPLGLQVNGALCEGRVSVSLGPHRLLTAHVILLEVLSKRSP